MTKQQIQHFYRNGQFTFFKAMHYLLLIGMSYGAAWHYLERTY